MSDWKPHGGPHNDESKELCEDCEGTSQCLLCCMHWDPKKKEWVAPYDPDCDNCGGTFECPTCDGTGLVDDVMIIPKYYLSGVYDLIIFRVRSNFLLQVQ